MDLILCYEPEDPSLNDGEESNGQAHDEEVERLNPGHMVRIQAMKENHYQKINPVKCGVKLTCVLTGSYKDKTNRLNRLKRKWTTRLKLSVLSDLWMELSSDLALKRPLTQANKQDIVNIRQSILTSWRFSHNISLYEPHLWNLFDHFIYLYLSFCNMVKFFFSNFPQIK